MSFIYVASPYSHADAAVREERYLSVVRFIAKSAEDYVLYSPIAHWHLASKLGGLPGDSHFWLKQNLVMLRMARGLWVLCLDGWEESVGVNHEIEVAQTLSMEIRYYIPYYDPKE
jgi:hypothetical protein